MSFTRDELQTLHQRSVVLGMGIFLLDFSGFAAASLGAVLAEAWIGQLALALLAGLFLSGLHVVAHDACHQSLTPIRWLNRLLGTVAFLPLLHPYSLWELAHNRTHHRFTNVKGKDYVWEPLTPGEYARLSAAQRLRYRFFRSFPGHFWYSLFEIWLKKLFFPRASEIGGYRKPYVADLALVSLWLGAWPLALWAARSLAGGMGGWESLRVALVPGFAVPFLVFQVLNSVVIYLHHTHPRVQWFTAAQAANVEHVVTSSSVHVVFPMPVNWLFHRIMEHTAHHLRPGIPLYRLARGQNLLEARHGEVVVERWSWRRHLAILRCCKLFDTERHCWTGYDGVPSSLDAVPDVFPLPLTPIEELLLSEDLPGSRQTFMLELSCDGEVDRASLEVGLDQALLRHPLFTARLERRAFGRPRWVHPGTMRPRVLWSGLEAPLEFKEDEHLDLEQEAGLRVYIQVGAGRTRFTVLFHHACCDAYGALQFLYDVVVGYARHHAPLSPDLPTYRPLTPALLVQRGNVRVSVPRGWERWRFLRTVAGLTFRLLVQRPLPPAVPPRSVPAATRPLPFPATLTRTLDRRIFRELRRVARRSGTTVNELLTRELLLVARDWVGARTRLRAADRLAIMLPTNLRNLDHDGIPAANVVGCIVCNRRADECADPARLLRSIREELEFARNSRFGALFLLWIDGLRRVPGLLRAVHAWGGTFATFVLSNVGDPLRAIRAGGPTTADGDPIFANLILRDVSAASPPPPQTPAAFTLWQIDDALRVGLRCNPRLFARDDAEALLDLFAARIVSLADRASSSPEIRNAA